MAFFRCDYSRSPRATLVWALQIKPNYNGVEEKCLFCPLFLALVLWLLTAQHSARNFLNWISRDFWRVKKDNLKKISFSLFIVRPAVRKNHGVACRTELLAEEGEVA